MSVEKVPRDIFDDEPGDAFAPKESLDQPDWFDEEAYLLANPDVQDSVGAAEFESAYQHYVLHGRHERRPLHGNSPERRNCLVRHRRTSDKSAPKAELRCSVEVAMMSPRGGLMVVGWVDDMSVALEWLKLSGTGWHMTLSPNRLARFRRTDVESALGAVGVHSFGFFAFAYAGEPLGDMESCKVTLCLTDLREVTKELEIRRVSEIELRNTALGYVADSEFFGNR